MSEQQTYAAQLQQQYPELYPLIYADALKFQAQARDEPGSFIDAPADFNIDFFIEYASIGCYDNDPRPGCQGWELLDAALQDDNRDGKAKASGRQ